MTRALQDLAFSEYLFNLESSGTEMVCLSSKTYVHGHMSKIQDPLQTLNSVLESGNSISVGNVGFRARNNTVRRYTQDRVGFGYFYCKREVLADGIRTKPLNLVLAPWKDMNVHYCDAFSPLGLISWCNISTCHLLYDNRDISSYEGYISYENATNTRSQELSDWK